MANSAVTTRSEVLTHAVASLSVLEGVDAASSALAPSPWFNLGTRVLLDRSGRLGSVLALSKHLPFAPTPPEVLDHLQKSVAALAEGAKRVRRGEPIYASRLCAEAVYYLLAADDILSCRAPFGSSKRERLVPGDLTECARASIGAPAMADSECYFSALSSRLRQLVARAESAGHCSGPAAAHLRTALDQLILLAAGRSS